MNTFFPAGFVFRWMYSERKKKLSNGQSECERPKLQNWIKRVFSHHLDALNDLITSFYVYTFDIHIITNKLYHTNIGLRVEQTEKVKTCMKHFAKSKINCCFGLIFDPENNNFNSFWVIVTKNYTYKSIFCAVKTFFGFLFTTLLFYFL